MAFAAASSFFFCLVSNSCILTPSGMLKGGNSRGSRGAWGAIMKYLLLRATLALALMLGSATSTRSSRDIAASDRLVPALPVLFFRLLVYVCCACLRNAS